ncbi:MAG: hypothetical protein QNK31_12455 [Porticoccus sp.]|nr:hypothetical protein [Porticoccus sp.]
MLSFINRLARDFELEHGIHPNLLYLNRFHAEHLKSAFDADYSMVQILDVLGMELVIENDITQPRVAWTLMAQRASAH